MSAAGGGLATAPDYSRGSDFVALQRVSDAFELACLVGGDRRECEVEPGERLNDNRGDDCARPPFPVCRYDVPWRVVGTRRPDGRLIGILVARPEASFLDVGGRELPALLRLVQPIEHPPTLFLGREVQEDLSDDGSVADQM